MNKFQELRQVCTAKWLPATNYKPSRYSIKIGNFKNKIISVDSSTVEFPHTAQALVERRIKELNLNWKINGAGLISDGYYVFTIR